MHFGALSDKVSPPSKTVWYVGLIAIARKVVLPFFTRSYDIHTEKYDSKIEEPCVMLYNHCSRRDFFVTVDGFRHYGRYILVDSFLRGPMLRFILPVLSDFIFRRRGEVADNVVGSAMATFKRGINVYLSPEGTTSQNGTTASIRKRTGKMISDAGVAMVTYKISGSYFIKPTWANYRAKGPIFGEVVNVYSSDEVKAMTVDEINETIARDIHINSYEWVKKRRIPYDRKNRAERMERVIYTCPKCKKVHTMRSMKDTFFCTECGYSVDVDEYGLYVGDEVIFDNMYDWDIWQINLLKSQRQDWIDNPNKVIATEYNLMLKEEIGDEMSLIEDGVILSISASKVMIKGRETDIMIPTDDVHSFFPSSLDTIGLTAPGKYYVMKAKIPICNRRFRVILKILRGEEIL